MAEESKKETKTQPKNSNNKMRIVCLVIIMVTIAWVALNKMSWPSGAAQADPGKTPQPPAPTASAAPQVPEKKYAFTNVYTLRDGVFSVKHQTPGSERIMRSWGYAKDGVMHITLIPGYSGQYNIRMQPLDIRTSSSDGWIEANKSSHSRHLEMGDCEWIEFRINKAYEAPDGFSVAYRFEESSLFR